MSKFNDMIHGLQDTEVPQYIKERTKKTLENLPDFQETKKAQKRNWMKYVATAAAVMITGIGICWANPALAAKLPFIGKIFEEVQSMVTFSGTFDKKAEVLEENSEMKPSRGVYTAESDGITITASEVYCDGLSVFLTAEVYMEKGGFNQMAGKVLYLDGSWKLSGDQEEKNLINQNLEGKVIDDQTFAGMLKIDLEDRNLEKGICDLRLSMIGYDDLSRTKEENIEAFHTYKAEWKLRIPFTIDTSASKSFEINKENKGYCLKEVFVSPYQVVAYTDVPYTEEKITREDYEKEMEEKTADTDYEDIGISYEEYVEQVGKTYGFSGTVIFDKNGKMLTPREEIKGRSVKAVQGADISKLYIYVFDDLDAMIEVSEKGMDCDAVKQAVVNTEVEYR